MRGPRDPRCAHLPPTLLQPVGGLIPAQAVVDDLAGEPAIVRIEGDWPGADAASVEFLAAVPVVTMAVGPAPPAVADACDLATADPAEADRWFAGFERAPHAAHAAALLVRTPPASTEAGLVAESTTYSLLQAGPEFDKWRVTHDRRDTDGRDSPRVRVERHGAVADVVLD
ncbi:MAG: hypothetical protein ACRDWD_16950, partial [Acidimicrobiia bacterium]